MLEDDTPSPYADSEWIHSKTGNRYRVLMVALNSSTLEPTVVYQALYFNPTAELWTRPMKEFLELVEINGKLIPRFQPV